MENRSFPESCRLPGPETFELQWNAFPDKTATSILGGCKGSFHLPSQLDESLCDVLVTVGFRIPVVSCFTIGLRTFAAWQPICLSNLPLSSSYKASDFPLSAWSFFFPQGQGSNSRLHTCQSGNSTPNPNTLSSLGLPKVDVQDGCPLGWSGKCWNFWLHSSHLFYNSPCI